MPSLLSRQWKDAIIIHPEIWVVGWGWGGRGCPRLGMGAYLAQELNPV
jgi:hypothetical protein